MFSINGGPMSDKDRSRLESDFGFDLSHSQIRCLLRPRWHHRLIDWWRDQTEYTKIYRWGFSLFEGSAWWLPSVCLNVGYPLFVFGIPYWYKRLFYFNVCRDGIGLSWYRLKGKPHSSFRSILHFRDSQSEAMIMPERGADNGEG